MQVRPIKTKADYRTALKEIDRLMDAKRRFRSILIRLLSETVDGTDALREEWRSLFARNAP